MLGRGAWCSYNSPVCETVSRKKRREASTTRKGECGRLDGISWSDDCVPRLFMNISSVVLRPSRFDLPRRSVPVDASELYEIARGLQAATSTSLSSESSGSDLMTTASLLFDAMLCRGDSERRRKVRILCV